MKAIICAAFMLAAWSCHAQYRTWEMRQRQAEQNYLNAVRAAEHRLEAQAKAQSNAQAKAQTNALATAAQSEKDHLANLPPIDPLRVVDGVQVPANGPGWFRFWGKVQSVTGEGLLLNGTYANSKETNHGAFVLIRFPQTRATGDEFTREKSWWAKDDGSTTYEGATYHRLDYGEVRGKLTDEEKAAQTQAQQARRAELMANAIALYQKQADTGDSSAQLRLGEIYRDGEGVPRDLAKARDYLAKAAAQGNQDAQKELGQLP